MKLTGSLEQEVITEGAALAPEAIIHARDKGRAEIDTATTTDTYHRDYTHALHPGVQIFGLERGAGGNPRLVLAFALPGDELVHTTLTPTQIVYPVRIQLMASRIGDGARTDLDSVREFSAPSALGKGQYLTGVVELPIPAGRYHVSAVFTQSDGRGANAHLDVVDVPGGEPALTASDLVLGRADGVRWNSGTTQVALNPLNTWPAGGSAEVYTQLSGVRPGAEYALRFDIFSKGDDAARPPRLTISATQVFGASRVEFTRTLGLANLDPGTYRVRLTISGAGRTATSEGWITIR
ncbi:MAG: hypothetical protein ACREL5_01605 [Gemmatimonadales bacterium]